MSERPEPKLSEPAIRFRSPMGSFPNTNLSPEEARKHMENIEAARESDFKPGSCDHEWSGRDGRCGMCGVRQSDEGTGVDRALNPDVTRNAMSPDELWAMQEKPHVSDDAPDMGPIPGTEGIESDPPVSDLSVEGSPPGGNQVPESPLPTEQFFTGREGWPKWVREIVEALEAERDTLKVDVAEMQRKLVKAMRQRNEFRAALYDARTAHRAEAAALRASEVSREALAQVEVERDDWQRMAERHKDRIDRLRAALRRIADMSTEPRPDGTHNYSRAALIQQARMVLGRDDA